MRRTLPARSPEGPVWALRPLISSATVPWPIEKTWKPPESVITGRAQRMKRCTPPRSRISSWPGARNRWNVFPSTMSKPRPAASRTSSVLTTALVARGTKAGVRTSPWARRSTPVRAREAGSRAVMLRMATGRGPYRRPVMTSPSGLDGLLGAAADLDPARLALLGLRDADLEHAAVEARADRVGVDALRERQRAGEAAERALDAVVALLVGLMLGLALAGDRERALLDLDLDVLLAHAGQIGPQDEVVAGLHEVHGRHPAPHRLAIARRRRVEDGVEEPIHLVLERAELAKRLPAHDRHCLILHVSGDDVVRPHY